MPDTAPEILEADSLAGLSSIRHGFFTRRGGVSGGVYAGLNCGIGSGDSAADVVTNRARVAAAFGLPPGRLATPYQVHGAAVVTVTEPWGDDSRPEADAVVTNREGIAIGVAIADCAPVLFADPLARIVGAAHAGWRGASLGVLEATVAAMEELGASRRRIAAAIGPAIGWASYEVGPEFLDRFIAIEVGNAKFFHPSTRPGHHRFDLPGYVRARLDAMHLRDVSALGLDTYSDEARFYSCRRSAHRGEADYGRMVAAIALN